MKLDERARSVQTREDFVAFVAEMKADYDRHRDTWENVELSSFLGAMSAWVRDMEGYYKHEGRNLEGIPTWRLLTDILMGARMYE